MTRLRSTADRIAALEADLKAERERLAGQLAAARDDGCEHSWKAIAAAGRRAPSRCHQIVAEN